MGTTPDTTTEAVEQRTYTLREAADTYNLDLPALRKRADRGTLQTVKIAGVRRVPHTELERAGLLPDARVLELEARVVELEGALAGVRLLEERAGKALEAEQEAHEHTRGAVVQFRAEATSANLRAGELAAELETLEQELATVPWWNPWRARGIARARLEAAEAAGIVNPAE